MERKKLINIPKQNSNLNKIKYVLIELNYINFFIFLCYKSGTRVFSALGEAIVTPTAMALGMSFLF